MLAEKTDTARTSTPGARVSPSSGLARTKRGSKIGLILVVWVLLLGWIGISSYNVIRQQDSWVYARDRQAAANELPDTARGSSGSIHEPLAAGAGVDSSAGFLLTSGLVVFFLATGIRLLMNRRTQ